MNDLGFTQSRAARFTSGGAAGAPASTPISSRALHAQMRAILANVERLTDPDDLRLHPSQLAPLGEIARCARAVLDALDPLQELERAGLGALPLRSETIAPEWLVRECARRIEPELSRGGHSLVTRCEPGLGAIDTDPWRVQQIVSWLARRAIRDAAPASTVRLDMHRDARADCDGRGANFRVIALSIDARAMSRNDAADHESLWEPEFHLEVARRVARTLGGDVLVRVGDRGEEIVVLRLPASDADGV